MRAPMGARNKAIRSITMQKATITATHMELTPVSLSQRNADMSLIHVKCFCTFL